LYSLAVIYQLVILDDWFNIRFTDKVPKSYSILKKSNQRLPENESKIKKPVCGLVIALFWQVFVHLGEAIFVLITGLTNKNAHAEMAINKIAPIIKICFIMIPVLKIERR